MKDIIEVDLFEIEMGYEAVDGSRGEIAVYVSRLTGEVVWNDEEHSGEPFLFEKIDEDDDYIHLPDKYDLDLGTVLVMSFAESVPEQYDEIARIFSRSGAYGYFRDLLDKHNLSDQWNSFEIEGKKKALMSWCERNGLKTVVKPPS